MEYQFKAAIKKGVLERSLTYVDVPPEIMAKINLPGRLKISYAIEHGHYHTTLYDKSDGSGYFYVIKDLLEIQSLAVGDTVSVRITAYSLLNKR